MATPIALRLHGTGIVIGAGDAGGHLFHNRIDKYTGQDPTSKDLTLDMQVHPVSVQRTMLIFFPFAVGPPITISIPAQPK